MRNTLLLTATLILAVGFIYYAGNITPTKTPRPPANPTVQPTTIAAPAPRAPLTLDQARQLTPSQRLDLIKKARLIEDSDEQADYLCILIESFTKEDIVEAAIALVELSLQQRSDMPQRVWDTLSAQWGRVAPATWFDGNIHSHVGKRNTDVRKVIKAWFETDPAAALAWAQSFRGSFEEFTAAAEVLTLSAAGDPQKLADSLLAIPAGYYQVKACLPAYFALIATTTGNPDPAAIYENIPTPLRDPAWGLTLERLTASNLHVAADWLTAHVNDPGCSYSQTCGLLNSILQEVGHARMLPWIATFPETTCRVASDHPGYIASLDWFNTDPVSAKAWLQTQPSTLHWVEETLKHIEEQENPKEPEADKTEN